MDQKIRIRLKAFDYKLIDRSALEIVETAKYRYEYEPNHPDADENGMVQYPDVDMVGEMAAMVSANRLYEANLSVIEAAKQIMKRSLEI